MRLEMDEKLELFYNRRSIRSFTDRPVNDQQIELLLKAAMAAPAAMNLKPWEFVVVRDVDQLKKLRKISPFNDINAPCAIVVCGNLGVFKRPLMERFWVQDCSAATENLLLAATVLGLGSLWCGLYPIKGMIKSVARHLELPGSVIPLALVFVGYGAEEKPARTQYDANKVFRERYSDKW